MYDQYDVTWIKLQIFTVLFGNCCSIYCTHLRSVQQMEMFLLPGQLCLQENVHPNCLLEISRLGIMSHVAYTMFDKVIMNLSGKVFFVFFLMLTSQKFPAPLPDTKPSVWEGSAVWAVLTLPTRFVWSHPSPSNSIQLWLKCSWWRVAVNHDPEASVCSPSETSTVDDSFEQKDLCLKTSLSPKLSVFCHYLLTLLTPQI